MFVHCALTFSPGHDLRSSCTIMEKKKKKADVPSISHYWQFLRPGFQEIRLVKEAKSGALHYR